MKRIGLAALILSTFFLTQDFSFADYKLNPHTQRLDYYEAKNFRGVRATEPSGPREGWTYINSSDYGFYIYYGEAWQLLHTLTPASYSFLQLEGVGITDVLLLETGDKLALEA